MLSCSRVLKSCSFFLALSSSSVALFSYLGQVESFPPFISWISLIGASCSSFSTPIPSRWWYPPLWISFQIDHDLPEARKQSLHQIKVTQEKQKEQHDRPILPKPEFAIGDK
ncbi:9673_t:CDS:2, partial [Gigaspora rosea]